MVLDQSDSVTKDNWKYYVVNAPASYANIKVELYNLSQDADLYVREGTAPTHLVHDCRPYKSGTINEICELPYSGATQWHIGVYGYSGPNPTKMNNSANTNSTNVMGKMLTSTNFSSSDTIV